MPPIIFISVVSPFYCGNHVRQTKQRGGLERLRVEYSPEWKWMKELGSDGRGVRFEEPMSRAAPGAAAQRSAEYRTLPSARLFFRCAFRSDYTQKGRGKARCEKPARILNPLLPSSDPHREQRRSGSQLRTTNYLGTETGGVCSCQGLGRKPSRRVSA